MPAAPKVLFVEDDDDHAELVLRTLEDHGAADDVFRVADGEAALDYLHRRGPFEGLAPDAVPSFVLLDLRLPKVDGLEVLREIKGSPELRRIPVVVLTTSDAEGDLMRAYELQANAYVVKPIDIDKLGALLRDLGIFWLTWNRQPPTAARAGTGGGDAEGGG